MPSLFEQEEIENIRREVKCDLAYRLLAAWGWRIPTQQRMTDTLIQFHRAATTLGLDCDVIHGHVQVLAPTPA